MDAVTFIGILVGLAGAFFGLYELLSSRDSKISNDAEWKGVVNTKLDAIHNDISGVGKDITEIKAAQADANKKLENHETRIVVMETKLGIEKEHTDEYYSAIHQAK